MADQNDVTPGAEMTLSLDMHFGDERAGGVQVEQLAPPGLGRHRFGHPVRGKDDAGAVGRHVQLVDEHRAQPLEPLHDETVVHDLVAHIDGCPVFRDGQFDDSDRPLHARAEAARAG